MSLQQRITALAQAVGADIRKLDVSRHPAIRPSLRLDFINCARLDPRITFTRASGGGRFNAAGQYEWLAADQPRIDYDPVTGECRGLLIEEQRTNLLTNSSAFVGLWQAKVVDQAGEIGFQKSTALIALEGTTGAHQWRGGSVSMASGTLHTLSVIAKPGASTVIRLRYAGGASSDAAQNSATFNLVTGQVISKGSGIVAASIAPAGAGYWQVSITGTKGSSSTGYLDIGRGSSTPGSLGETIYAGDGATVEFFVLHNQIEVGAFPASPIPTTTAQVTRAASDPLLQTLSPWFNQSAGTFIIEHDAVAGRPLLSSGETLLASSGGAGRTVLAYDATGSYVSQNVGAFVAGPPLAFGDSLRLMRSATQWANAHCRALRYYPRRLTLAEASA